MTSRERVKAIFKGEKPDKIVRGNIDFNPEAMKELLKDKYTGDEIKDKISAAEMLGLDILAVSALKERDYHGKIIGRFGIIDGRNIYKGKDGNYYEILKNYKIVKLGPWKEIDDSNLPFNLYRQGGGVYYQHLSRSWIVPPIKNLNDIRKYGFLFQAASRLLFVSKLFGIVDFGRIKRAKKETDLFVLCGVSSGFSSLANTVFGGYERFIEFIYKHPEAVKKIVKAMVGLQTKAMIEMIKQGADGILICDDLAGERPIVSPDIFREFFFSAMTRQVGAAKKMGVPVVLHTDGNIKELIDDLFGDETKTVEIKSVDGRTKTIIYQQLGLDGVECLERPYFTSDDLAHLKIKYPDKVLWGNVNNLDIASGESKKIKKLVREIIQTLKAGSLAANKNFVNDIIGESNVTTFSDNPASKEKQCAALKALYQEAGKFSSEVEIKPRKKSSLMIGSIFYKGDGLVIDGARGKFDEKRVKEILEELEALFKRTGIPTAVDVVAETPLAMEKYIGFVAKNCSLPFLIDGVTPEARMAGAKVADNLGVSSRAIYSPINPDIKEEEIEFLKKSAIKKAVLLCINPGDISARGRLEVFKKLASIVHESGIEKIYADTNLLDMGDLETALEAVRLIKNQMKVFCGFAPINALSLLDKNQRKMLTPKLYSDLYRAVSEDADFIFYGPIKLAPKVYSALLFHPESHSLKDILEAVKQGSVSSDEMLSAVKEKGIFAYNFALTVVKKDMEAMEKLCHEFLDKYCYKDGKYLPHPEVMKTINDGISSGMMIVSRQFARKDIYLNDVLRASEAMNMAIEILRPYVTKTEEIDKPKVVLGLIYPNIQELGKKIVGIALEANGFQVYDIGKSVLPDAFVEKAKEVEADIIGISVYTNEALGGLEKIIRLLNEQGLRNKIKVIIGGAAASAEVAEQLGADAYGADAAEAVEICSEFCLNIKTRL